jgi:hypothetical protein
LLSDAETFYNHQRSIALAWGILLPSWGLLSWEEQMTWEDNLNEQLSRDKEALLSTQTK